MRGGKQCFFLHCHVVVKVLFRVQIVHQKRNKTSGIFYIKMTPGKRVQLTQREMESMVAGLTRTHELLQATTSCGVSFNVEPRKRDEITKKGKEVLRRGRKNVRDNIKIGA